jgi:hypothetical protein
MLGFSARKGTVASLQLILWYAEEQVEAPGLNWAPDGDLSSPSVLSDTSGLGVALAWQASLPPVAESDVFLGPAEYLSWIGTDPAQTVNLAAALADDPTNADASAVRNDVVKTTFWGQTSQLPSTVASVSIPGEQWSQSPVAVIAWAGTGNQELNILNASALPGAAAGSQAILSETSPCGPKLLTVNADLNGSVVVRLWLIWVGTDGSMNILDFSPLSSPAGVPAAVGTGKNAVVIQTPSLCCPAVVGGERGTIYIAWIDRPSGKLALASGTFFGPWQNMTLYDLTDANGNPLQPWPNGGVSMVMGANGLLVACVDSQYQTARVFQIPIPN